MKEKREELKASVNDNDEKKQEFEEINRRTKRKIWREVRGTHHRIDREDNRTFQVDEKTCEGDIKRKPMDAGRKRFYREEINLQIRYPDTCNRLLQDIIFKYT